MLQGASWVVLFVFLGKLVGAAKEMAIAYQFGVSSIVDAYQVAFVTVTWLPTTLVAALSTVLVPLFMQVRFESAESETLFVREVQGVMLVFGILLVLLTILAGGFYVNRIAGNLPSGTKTLAIHFALGLSPVAALTLIIGVLSARLQSHGKQLNTLFEGIPALAIMVCILLPLFSLGSDALLWGTLAGFILNAVLLSVVASSNDGVGWKGSFKMTSPHWSEMYKAVSVMAFGQFVMSFVTPLDQYMAAQLPAGSIATLGYANRLLGLGLSIGAMAIARGAMPVLANAIAQGNNAHACSLALKWSFVMLIVGILTVVVGWFLTPYAVRFMFERGAFTATDTVAVTTCLRWGLLQVPGYFSGLVLVQLFASLRQYHFVALVACGNFVVKLLVSLILMRYLGLAGLMMASGVMYLFAYLCCWLRVNYIKSNVSHIGLGSGL